MRISKAMLLAAGHGTRLGSLTEAVPKPMLLVGGKPLLEFTIRRLVGAGIREAMINLHRFGETVETYFGDGTEFGVRLYYSHETELLGTAGAIKKCEDFFRGEPFLVHYGDNLTTCRLDRLEAQHRAHGGLGTIALFWRDDVSAHSAVELDADLRIVRFVEKPPLGTSESHWISAGVILFESEVLDFIPAKGPSDFGFHVFPRLLAEGKPLYGYHMAPQEGLWWIDTPSHYARVQELWSHGVLAR